MLFKDDLLIGKLLKRLSFTLIVSAIGVKEAFAQLFSKSAYLL